MYTETDRQYTHIYYFFSVAATAPAAGEAKQEEKKIQRNPEAQPGTNKLKTNKDKKKGLFFPIYQSRPDLGSNLILCSLCKTVPPAELEELRWDYCPAALAAFCCSSIALTAGGIIVGLMAGVKGRSGYCAFFPGT